MIVAAGLSPAWQQMLLFDRFQVGEVNRAREVHWCASGKVLNVGLALHHLGGSSVTVALVGGFPGDIIRRELTALGVPHRLVSSSRATRVCSTILDSASGRTTELVENAPAVEEQELEEFRERFEEAASGSSVAILSGSLPAGAPPAFYRELIERAPSARVILDARGPELVETLAMEPFCVKPNREELARTCGRVLSTQEELRGAMEDLNSRGAKWVVVSGGTGELWATSAGALHRFVPLEVDTVNPIGCGDCLAAGIGWALAQGEAMPQAIRIGVAAAAENAAMLLPGRLDPDRVRRRSRDVRVL